MQTYWELEKLKKYHGEICIFGCGQLSKYDAYELLKIAGFKINYYCDNSVFPGTVIRDEIEVRELQYLYDNKESTLVFVCVSLQYQNEL